MCIRDRITGLQRIAARLHANLATHARRRHARLLEMSLGRLVFLVRPRFDQPELHGFIAVFTCETTQGPAFSTVAGCTAPSGPNSCVMPTFFPISPVTMATSRVPYR